MQHAFRGCAKCAAATTDAATLCPKALPAVQEDPSRRGGLQLLDKPKEDGTLQLAACNEATNRQHRSSGPERAHAISLVSAAPGLDGAAFSLGAVPLPDDKAGTPSHAQPWAVDPPARAQPLSSLRQHTRCWSNSWLQDPRISFMALSTPLPCRRGLRSYARWCVIGRPAPMCHWKMVGTAVWAELLQGST